MRRPWLIWLLLVAGIALATVLLFGRSAPWKHPRPIEYHEMQKG